MPLVGFFSNLPEIGGAVPTLEAAGHLLFPIKWPAVSAFDKVKI